jgi:DNA-binding transcriptional LysR family regulator
VARGQVNGEPKSDRRRSLSEAKLSTYAVKNHYYRGMKFDLERLSILAAVARSGSMTAAAEELSYTPSAVSQQIRRLESELHTAMVDRHPRGVTLTEAGHAVVARAEAISGQLRGLENDLNDLAGLRAGTLRIGVFPTFAASLLPSVITRFRSRHPGIALEVLNSRKAPIRELLISGEIDLGLAWDYPWNRVEDPAVVAEELMLDPTILLLPATHPMAARMDVELADLKSEAWVVRADHPTRDVLERCARTHDFVPNVAAETNDYPELQAMIAAGFGIAMCPGLATQPLRDDLVVRRLRPDVPARRISTAYSAGRAPSPSHQAMVSAMRSVAASRPI